MRRFLTTSLLVMLSLLFVQEVNAQFTYYEGTIDANSGTFNRPSGLTTLSGVSAPFHIEKATISTDCPGPGPYLLSSTQIGFDGVICVYARNFNPNRPLENLIAFDDDTDLSTNLNTPQISAGLTLGVGEVSYTSQITVDLTPGVEYFVVTTTFTPGESGRFTNTAKILLRSEACEIDFEAFVLPIELTRFSAKLSGNAATLDWATALELENKGFEIQHAQEQGNEELRFETLDFVVGNGTTNQAQSYSYQITDLGTGRHYFRLKQIDHDGTYSFSDIEAVEVKRQLGTTATIFPNPISSASVLTLNATQKGLVTADIIGIDGRQITRLFEGTMEEGGYQQISLSNAYHKLPYHGVYFIVLKGESINEVIRFVH